MIWDSLYGQLPSVIKAITISQPWGNLIANGEKLIENRIWETRHRGWLAIHAGSGKQYLDREQLKNYPTGCVIALARLIGCYSKEELTRGSIYVDESQWPYIEGPYCWMLDVVHRVEPYAIPGKQGLWDLNTSPLVAIRDPQPLPVPDHPLRKMVVEH